LVLPTTYASALLLLLLGFVCLGSWANTFRLAGARWRFELFYFDFAIGALLLAVVAAYTFGTLGSDLAFSDRMLVAGRAAQAYVMAAGFIFNLGNMLLVAAISLIGMSAAFPLSIGVALIIVAFFDFTPGNVLFLVGGIVLMVPALLLDGVASRSRDVPQVNPTKTPHRSLQKAKGRKTTKGVALGIVSGILLGCFYPVASKGMAGDFGLGPYAGSLLFCLGVLASTLMFNFYFMNIAIEGGPIRLNAYFTGQARQHFLGFGGGALWALGALATSLAISSPSQTGLNRSLGFILPLASVLLAMLWGAMRWKEFATAPKSAKVCISLTAVLFTCSLVLFGFGTPR